MVEADANRREGLDQLRPAGAIVKDRDAGSLGVGEGLAQRRLHLDPLIDQQNRFVFGQRLWCHVFNENHVRRTVGMQAGDVCFKTREKCSPKSRQ